jgi:hypothetical protein
LKRKTPRGVWALRGVTAAITLIVLVVVATVGYSAYEDYSGIRSGAASGSSLIAGSAVYDEATGGEIISFNVTVPNRGLYSVNVTIDCSSSNSAVACQRASALVPPGQSQLLRFVMTVSDVKQFLSSPDRQINGTVDLGLEPFASLSVGVNFTSFVQLPEGA